MLNTAAPDSNDPKTPINVGDAAGGDLDGTFPDPIIRDGAVTADKIAPGAVGDAELADGSITAAKLSTSLSLAAFPLNLEEQIVSGLLINQHISDTAQISTSKLAEGLRFINDYGNFVMSGTKIFTDPRMVSPPLVGPVLANKDYVDYKVMSGLGSSALTNNSINLAYMKLPSVSGNVIATPGISQGHLLSGYVDLNTYQVISGEKIFLRIKAAGNPISPTDLATKAYVDANAGGTPAVNSIDITRLQQPSVSGNVIATPGISRGHIALNQIFLGHLTSPAVSGNVIATPGISTGHIALNTIINSQLQSASISGNVIATPAISTGNIALNTIILSQMQLPSVSGNVIATPGIGTAHIAPNQINLAHLLLPSVSGNVIATPGISTGHIATNSIALSLMQLPSVSGNVIATPGIGPAHLAAGSVVNTTLAANSVDLTKLQLPSVSGNVIATPGISTGHIALNTIINSQLQSASVSGNVIATPGISQAHIAPNNINLAHHLLPSVSGNVIATPGISTGHIALNTIILSQMQLPSVSGNVIATPGISTGHIATNSIALSLMQLPSVSGNVIATPGIGPAHLAAGSVINTTLAANSVDLTKLQLPSVSGNVIATPGISTGHIALNTLINSQFQSASVSGNVIATPGISTGHIALNTIILSQLTLPSVSGNVIATPGISQGHVLSGYVDLNTYQVISGEKIFLRIKAAGNPISPTDLATKAYVDANTGGVPGVNSIDITRLQQPSVSGNVIATPGISTGHIALNTIINSQLQSASVSGNVIATPGIGQAHIAPNNINLAHHLLPSVSGNVIATPGISTGHIALNALINSQFQSASVSGNVIATPGISTGHIATNSIALSLMQLPSVSGNVIATPGISAGHLAAGSVVNTTLAANSVDLTKLQQPSVSGNVIATPGISQAHIAPNNINLAHHLLPSVSGNVIATPGISTGHIALNTLINTQYQSASISGNVIAQPAIAGPNISGFPNNAVLFYNGVGGWSVPTGPVYNYSDNSIRLAALQLPSVSGNVIATPGISTGHIALNTLINSQLQSASVSGNVIATPGISTGHIALNALINSQFQSASVSGNVIATPGISTAHIALNTIINSQLQSASISGNVIAQPAIGGPNIAGYPNDVTKFLNGTGGWTSPSASGGNKNSETITQPGHGFSAGHVLMYSGIGTAISAGWMKAKADTAYNAEALGVVQSVTDANNFIICYNGHITTLSGINPGSVYFLDDSIAGNLVPIPPVIIGHVIKPILVGISGTGTTAGSEAIVINGLGQIIGSGTQIINGNQNFIAKFSNVSSVINSVLYETGGNVGVNTQTPVAGFDIRGSVNISGATTAQSVVHNGSTVLNGPVAINGMITNSSGCISGNAIISQSILNGHLALTSISGNVIGASAILNGHLAPNSIDITKLQSGCISGNVIATQSILPGHILGGLQANRNKIINGDFAVWQRLSGLSFNINNASTKKNYTADRWNLNVINGNGIWQVFREQRDHPYHSNFYTMGGYTVKVICSGSDTMGDARSPNTDATRLATFHTVLENSDLTEFDSSFARNITLSFWIKASKTGYINLFMRPYTTDFSANNNNNFPSRSFLSLATVNQKDTWEYKQVVMFTGIGQLVDNLFCPSNPPITVNPVLSGVAVGMTLQCGNQFQYNGANGTIQGSAGAFNDSTKAGGINIGTSSGQTFNTAGDYFYLCNMQLEVTPKGGFVNGTNVGEVISGTVATPFESMPYQQQLAKCQRYCYTLRDDTGAGSINLASIGLVLNAGAVTSVLQTPVPLRVVPTLTTVSGNTGNGPSGSWGYWSAGDNNVNQTVNGFIIQNTALVGNTIRFDANTTAQGLTGFRPGYIFANKAGIPLIFNADF